MTIECIGYRAHQSGALQGFANFKVIPKNGAAYELFGCGIFMKNGHRWASMPSREYVDKDSNEKKYIDIFRYCEKNINDAFKEGAIKALDEWCANNAAPEPQPLVSQEYQPPQDSNQQEGLPF